MTRTAFGSNMKGVQQPMGGMRMIKLIRLISLALMLCMLAGFAAADDLTTSVLPACYQFVLVGAARVYASEPVDVRSQPESDAEIVGQVKPEQQVHVEEVDQESGMTFIFYYEDGRLPGWDAEDAITGWIPTESRTDRKTAARLSLFIADGGEKCPDCTDRTPEKGCGSDILCKKTEPGPLTNRGKCCILYRPAIGAVCTFLKKQAAMKP